MANDSPPAAHSPKTRDEAEVLSRGTIPDGGEAQEAPEGETPIAGHQGESTPSETGGEGRIQFVPQPDSILETEETLESSTHPPSKEGGCLFHRWPLSNQGHRTVCWKRCEVLPLRMSTMSLWAR